jgi:hypothetical protein
MFDSGKLSEVILKEGSCHAICHVHGGSWGIALEL